MKNIFIITTSVLLFISNLSHATDVGGIINSDTTWTLAGSPYILTSDVEVQYGAMLTIEPGVYVFGSGYNLNVFGSLIAIGNSSSKITFINVEIEGWGASQENPHLIHIQFSNEWLMDFRPVFYQNFSRNISVHSDL